MDRRIFGLETEFGITCMSEGRRTLSADEVSRYLFRKVVTWGRSSNVFLGNGARLYLDVGSHPEYATAECDDLRQLIAQDKAGERIVENLQIEAQERITKEGLEGDVYLFKNNTDSSGNSYGCHENYLISRTGDFSKVSDVLLPFLVTRQLIVGAGKLLPTPSGTTYCLSQRAEHMWEGVSSATTRSRPIINTRDEPHADSESYRRLHVIVGDSNLSEVTTLVKVGMAHLMLRMLEAGESLRTMTLENPITAIREISQDVTGTHQVDLAAGGTISALQMQTYFFEKAEAFAQRQGIEDPAIEKTLDVWGRAVNAFAAGRPELMERDLDWVIKKRFLDRYQEKHGLANDDFKLARLELAYHDILRSRGLFYRLQAKGLVDRVVTDEEIERAVNEPPQTTRAKLRGDFIRAARSQGRDYTVDWVHLKLNDHPQRTVLCKDPFASVDERVEQLLEPL